MKILIATALLGALGLGSFHFAHAASTATAPKPAQSCEASVSCTPQGTCEITCHSPDGASCSIEIACDGQNCHIVGCHGPHDCPLSCPPGCR